MAAREMSGTEDGRRVGPIVVGTNLSKLKPGPERDALERVLKRILSGNARIEGKKP